MRTLTFLFDSSLSPAPQVREANDEINGRHVIFCAGQV